MPEGSGVLTMFINLRVHDPLYACSFLDPWEIDFFLGVVMTLECHMPRRAVMQKVGYIC